MSGFEILEAVTSITAAFNGSATAVLSWQEKAKERHENKENQQLLRSLTSAATTVKGEYEECFARLGRRYSSGDGDISRNELDQCLTQLRRLHAMIAMESAGTHLVAMPSLVIMLALSDNTSARAVAVLREQYERMVEQVDISQPFVSLIHRSQIRGSVASETDRGVFRRASTTGYQTDESLGSGYHAVANELSTNPDSRPQSWMSQQASNQPSSSRPRPLSDGFYPRRRSG